jgi:hypothetical protein
MLIFKIVLYPSISHKYIFCYKSICVFYKTILHAPFARTVRWPSNCWEKVYKLKTQITRPHSKEKEQKLKEQRLKDQRRKIIKRENI